MVVSLYTPKEIQALTNGSGEPAVIIRNGKRVHVAAILNTWRIDDEWWREMISRQYFQLELKDGPVMTIFHDLTSDKWFQQRY